MLAAMVGDEMSGVTQAVVSTHRQTQRAPLLNTFD
jgi:hypothetical protein